MQRRRRHHFPKQPPFDYESHNLKKENVPLFITLVLDNIYRTKEEKEDFLERFGYEYLNSQEFRNNTNNKVLVFEGIKYIGYTDRDNLFKIGNVNNPKNIINIGKLTNSGLFGNRQISN